MLAADAAPASLAGLEVVDRRGERLGRVRQVYRDGDRLGWVGVRGNLFGTEEVLVPLDGAVLEDDVVAVTVPRSRFAAAPRRRPDARLADGERAEVRAFWSEPVAEAEAAATPAEAAAGGSGPDAPAEEAGVMTASEERLRVETERVPRTRVRLQKVVVTEQRTLTVPVRREEYRLIREPIEGAAPVEGAVIGPEEQEVVLYEERVVVTTEVVPVERIRLVKEEVVDRREVTGEVRRERIDLVSEAGAVALPAALPDEVEDPVEPVVEAVEVDEVPPAAGELEAPAQPAPTASAARATSTKRATSSRSPRRAGSTPARSSTSAAADAPPSTGASD
ncbi:DUF2382 domain-containing protein [Amnibacterium setariae]|uniref:DUF2382 domain-containing protein n=1 Tax=Amnibacterium setariae TaxID=2306585 RepID=A0A3A1U306_9MICO|nr:DUF2382 domain-containing protein [Amnibacterium setariae]